jgi:hypothetical protein
MNRRGNPGCLSEHFMGRTLARAPVPCLHKHLVARTSCVDPLHSPSLQPPQEEADAAAKDKAAALSSQVGRLMAKLKAAEEGAAGLNARIASLEAERERDAQAAARREESLAKERWAASPMVSCSKTQSAHETATWGAGRPARTPLFLCWRRQGLLPHPNAPAPPTHARCSQGRRARRGLQAEAGARGAAVGGQARRRGRQGCVRRTGPVQEPALLACWLAYARTDWCGAGCVEGCDSRRFASLHPVAARPQPLPRRRRRSCSACATRARRLRRLRLRRSTRCGASDLGASFSRSLSKPNCIDHGPWFARFRCHLSHPQRQAKAQADELRDRLAAAEEATKEARAAVAEANVSLDGCKAELAQAQTDKVGWDLAEGGVRLVAARLTAQLSWLRFRRFLLINAATWHGSARPRRRPWRSRRRS